MKNKQKLELIKFFNLSQKRLDRKKDKPSEMFINKYKVVDSALDELKEWASSVFNYDQLEDFLIYCVSKNNPKDRLLSFPQFFINTFGKKNIERNYSLFITANYEACIEIIFKFNIYDQPKDKVSELSTFSFLSTVNELEVELENSLYQNSWFFITNEDYYEVSDIKLHLKLLIIDLIYTQLNPNIEKVIEYIGALAFQIPTFSKQYRFWAKENSENKNKIDKF